MRTPPPNTRNGVNAVACRDLCLGYQGRAVLRDVNLTIARGALLPFVGPNGGGKTTLLRGILGLIPALSGSVEVHNRGLPIGYVPQQKTIDPLYPVPVEQIVAMGLYPRLGWWRPLGREGRAQVARALREVGLEAAAGKNFRELSGGMKQRALIARALAMGAEIIVLDEPTSELDGPAERGIVRQLYRLCAEQGKTILIACHGVQLAVQLADHVCLVEHGNASVVHREEARRFTEMSLDVHEEPLGLRLN